MHWYDFTPLALGLAGALLIWLKRNRLGYALLVCMGGFYLWSDTRGVQAPWWHWALDAALTGVWTGFLVGSWKVNVIKDEAAGE
jgi:hypothetical protein